MRDKGAPAGQIQLGLTAEKLDPEITVEERPAPAIMIAAHERDRDAAGAYLLELGDGGKVFAGDDALILEPEIEQIAGHDEVVADLGYFFEEGVKRGPDAGWDLAEVGVRYDEDARNRGGHGPSLESWNRCRKPIGDPDDALI